MYGEQEWRELRRLRAAGISQAEIARRFAMSRTTVRRLLQLDLPPRYHRPTATVSGEYTPEEQHNLRMLARALVATARQMLEEEAANQASGLEPETVQVSAVQPNTDQIPK